MTGVMASISPEIIAKPFEMMRAIRPGLKLGVSFVNPVPGDGSRFASMQTVAGNLGLQLVQLPEMRDMAGIDPMLAAAKKEGIQGLMLGSYSFLMSEGLRRIQAWATENNVLTSSLGLGRGEFLIVHGPSFPLLQAALYSQIDQVLRGGNPAEIPFQAPMVFDIVISKKIAKAIGLTIPTSVLLQATEVID